MAAILTATVTTSFASLLAALPLGAWGLRYTTLAKNAEREKLEEEFVLIAPSWENFNFHTCCCCCWTAGSKVGKSLSDHHHNLLEVKIDALLGLQLFFSLFSVLPTQKSTRKSAVKLTGSCQPPPRHIYFGGRARGGQRSWKKKKITNFNGQ